MNAEILATGDEIRCGALADTNSAHIAERLEALGLSVVRHTAVGDELSGLVAVLREIAGRSTVAVVTGGLGPTTDDRSAEAAAAAAGVGRETDVRAMAEIEAFFRDRGRRPAASNRKQALLPVGAETLYNPVGTAPGFAMEIGGCRFFFLPGVPHEMERMLREDVLPRIDSTLGPDREVHRIRTLSTFGLPESTVGDRTAEVEGRFPGVRLGLRAKFPEIQVKLYAGGRDPAALEALLDEAETWVRGRLGSRIFGGENDTLASAVGDLLRRRGATLALAESCTGGLIAHQLTEVPGSSEYFLFSGVTYSNAAKGAVLGVCAETLKRRGAVSEETAREMAEGARRTAGADYGLSTTGIAGPDGGSPEKPVGTVCIGIAGPRGSTGRRLQLGFPRRWMNKTIFAAAALDLLRRELLENGP